MTFTDSRLLASVMVVAGVLLMVHGFGFAAEGYDKCSTHCWERSYLVHSPDLKCYSHIPASCVQCGLVGRCRDLIGPYPDSCVMRFDLLPRVDQNVYPAGCCMPLCDLNLNNYAESGTPIGSCTPTNQGLFSRYICEW